MFKESVFIPDSVAVLGPETCDHVKVPDVAGEPIGLAVKVLQGSLISLPAFTFTGVRETVMAISLY